MSASTTGIIYFSRKLNEDELNEIAFSLVKEAAEQAIGILLGGNIPPWTREWYAQTRQKSTSADGCEMLFHLSESAYHSNCDKLFEPIWIAHRTADVSQSALPRVQSFFEAVFTRKEIALIQLDITDGSGTEVDPACVTCSPHLFCAVIEREIARSGAWIPSLQMMIERK